MRDDPRLPRLELIAPLWDMLEGYPAEKRVLEAYVEIHGWPNTRSVKREIKRIRRGVKAQNKA